MIFSGQVDEKVWEHTAFNHLRDAIRMVITHY